VRVLGPGSELRGLRLADVGGGSAAPAKGFAVCVADFCYLARPAPSQAEHAGISSKCYVQKQWLSSLTLPL